MGKENDPLMEPGSLRDLLSFRLNTLAKKVTMGSQTILADRHGVNMREIRILMSLHQYQQITSSELAELTDLDKSTISRGIKDLMRRGLVNGTVDQADLRSSVLGLTGGGAKVAAECFDISQERLAQVLAGLSRPERGVLDQFLTRLERRVDDLNEDLKAKP